MEGQGSYSFKNGNLYIGEFVDGKREGLGIFTYSNGNKYIGEFKNGNMEGQGTFTYPNTNPFISIWISKGALPLHIPIFKLTYILVTI
jgi:hypothetical protein